MARRRKAKPGRDPVDTYVGERVQSRRKQLGMSRAKVGAALGITYQQVQKCELGTNRIGASRLYALSDVLDVPISFFFDGLEAVAGSAPVETGQGNRLKADVLQRPETLELVRMYYGIRNPEFRRRLRQFVKSLS